jgi:Zn-dependent protease with chaperone function
MSGAVPVTGDAAPGPVSSPALPGLPVLPPAPPLPGRARLTAGYAAAALGCLAVSAVLLLGPDPILSVLPLATLAGTAAARPVTRFRMSLLLGARQYRPLPRDQAVAALEAALRPAGIRQVHVLACDQVRGLARNYQAGDAALILILDSLLRQPELIRFFIAHEAAHLARHDTVLRPLLINTAACCWLAVALSWPLAVAAAPLIGLAFAVYSRRMELSCDRIAARWTGAAAARFSLGLLIRLRDQGTRGRAARLRGQLTYPPVERRLAVVDQVCAANQGWAAGQDGPGARD